MLLTDKGKFEIIKNEYIKDCQKCFSDINIIIKEYNKNDIDTIINEYHDSVVAKYLGFEYVNTNKHGFDAKALINNEEYYLESKVCSFGVSSWKAVFNDTNMEKALIFKNKNIYLALSVWTSITDLLFICFGSNEKIGQFLEEKVQHFLKDGGIRSTQNIPVGKLISEYDFKILSVAENKNTLYDILINKSKSFKKIIKDDTIIELKDFGGFNCNYTKVIA